VFAQDCIDTSIPFIRLTDTVGYVLELMQEYKTDALVIAEKNLFVGSVTEKLLLECDDLSSHRKFTGKFSIAQNSGRHPFV
jgi:predicted transcriptional regulator